MSKIGNLNIHERRSLKEWSLSSNTSASSTSSETKKIETRQETTRIAGTPSPRYYTVQCPYCDTSFNIECEHVQHSEYPHFHCSKCDNIFSQKRADLQPYRPVRTRSQLPKKRSIKLEPQHIPVRNQDLHTHVEEQIQPEIKAPHEVISYPTEPETIEETPIVTTQDGQLELTLDLEEGTTTRQVAEATPKRRTERPKSIFWILALPITVTLGTLAVMAFLLSLSPGTSDKLLTKVSSNTPVVPSHEVELSQIALKQVPLDDGQIRTFITAVLQNGSKFGIKEAELEILLFDEQGNKINGLREIAGSPLGIDQVDSLTDKVLTTLLNNQSTVDVQAGGNERITVYIPEDLLRGANYYGVRIFSIFEAAP